MREKRSERGAAAVEFALIVPFLVMILIGMVTIGFVYNDHLSVSNAVREGARFGAAVDFTVASPSGGTWAESVRDRVEQVYFDGHNDTKVEQDKQVCVKIVDGSGNPPTGAAPGATSVLGSRCTTTTPPSLPSNMAAGSCVVMVWVTRDAHIDLIIFPTMNLSIGAQSVAYYGRKAGSCTAL